MNLLKSEINFENRFVILEIEVIFATQFNINVLYLLAKRLFFLKFSQ